MRIVYLHQYFSTDIGGTRSYEMARRLVAMGHDVQMVTSDRAGARGPARQWSHTSEAGIDVHWLPVPYSNQMNYRARLGAFARFALFASQKAAQLRGDVVFATSTPLTIAVPAVHAAWRNSIPMVFEVRDLWPAVPIALGALRSPIAIAAARWLERFAYKHAAHIVALSPTIRDGILRTGYPEDRVDVIPNACDLEIFDVGPGPGRELRQRHAWLGSRPLVVYTGTLGQVNGVGYLAQLAAEVRRLDPDVCFVVIGEGREEAAVRRRADELGVLGLNFFMMPAVAKREVAQWLSAADVATSVVIDVPELQANAANKVFDALAAGTPVAINHEGWQADLLRETGAGIVLNNRDIPAAAAELLAVLRDREWLARAGAAAGRLARGQFTRDRLAAQLERILRTTAEQARHPERTDRRVHARRAPETAPAIRLSPPHLSGLEQTYVADAFDTNGVASSAHVEAFEAEFSQTVGGLPAVALSSGTAAIHLALHLAGVGRGDEVLVSTLTFVASVNPILYLGATPILVDSERTSWNMDPALLAEGLEASIRRTGRPPKAVIVVHLYGQSADLDAVLDVCRRYEVPLVEDAAEALGALYQGRTPGTFGLLGAYSFNNNKIITTSGGGMLVSPDPALVAHARKLATQAREPVPHYEHREVGYNYRLSNMLAALGRGQLRVLADRVAARRRNFALYAEALGDLPGVEFMPEAPWGRHSRWLTCLTINPREFGADRDVVRLALAAQNIEARPVWKPMHLQPVFSSHQCIGGGVAADLFTRGLCLPSGSNLTLLDVERVAGIVREVHRGAGSRVHAGAVA